MWTVNPLKKLAGNSRSNVVMEQASAPSRLRPTVLSRIRPQFQHSSRPGLGGGGNCCIAAQSRHAINVAMAWCAAFVDATEGDRWLSRHSPAAVGFQTNGAGPGFYQNS
jgi:hypothetical protein